MALAVALSITGCATSLAPADTTAPRAPAAWPQATPRQDPVSADWWRTFGNAELDTLVTQARQQSLDVDAAVARLRQAEANARIAGASRWPEVSATASAGRQARIGGTAAVDGSVFGAGANARYEVDFWGRWRAAHNAARAELQASAFDRDAVQLIVTANVASGWLQAVALRERVAIAERNLASAERLLALVETRVQAGAATPLELAQQRGLALGQRRQVTALRQQAEDAGSTLARLLGQTEAPRLATATLATLQVPAPGPGLPSDLLVRRPDIARAEAQLVAASANVQAARAAMLPRLTLTAALGTESDRLGRVFDNPLYSLAAGLTAPIFDAGRLAANRDGAQARREELLATYRQAIVTAFADVEVALHAVARLDEQAATQAEELVQAERAVQLAENRYRAGAETLLTLLDSQGKWYTAQDLAVQLKGLRLQAAVSLYRSLGGGWQPGPASSLYSLR